MRVSVISALNLWTSGRTMVFQYLGRLDIVISHNAINSQGRNYNVKYNDNLLYTEISWGDQVIKSKTKFFCAKI